LAIVVQGRKRAVLNDEVFHYDALNYLVVGVTLPALGQVLEASPEHPYLSLRLNLDLEEIARLVLQLGERVPSSPTTDRGLFVAPLGRASAGRRIEAGEAARYAGGYRRARTCGAA